ncbi:MAG: LOG family protein [bacterium]
MRHFPSAEEDRLRTHLDPETPQTSSPAYRLGFADNDFLLRDELRAVRLQLEFLKPDILQRDRDIVATVAVFGSSRIPAPEKAAALLAEAERGAAKSPDDPRAAQRERAARSLVAKSRYYDEARSLARMISERHTEPGNADSAAPRAGDGTSPCGRPDPEHIDACTLQHGPSSVVVVTGGGPGIMEAANRGAHDVGADNIGLNIVLPFEQAPNAYVTPHLCFNFHYYAIRKMHFLSRALALVVFPGGFGTLDELFEVLTLIQTHKIEPIPVLLFGREYWERIIDFGALAEEGVIAADDLDIFSYVETAVEAWQRLEPVLAVATRRS